MKQRIRLGVVCLARKTFDYEAAKQIYNKIIIDLGKMEEIIWEIIPELVIDLQDGVNVAKILALKEIDGFICISGTFALGDLILEMNKIINRPILLWGLEELPYDGGKIRLNSVCGINLNASNLYKAGIQNYYVIIGDKVDEDWIDAIRILKAFSSSHIGFIGSRADGFCNLDVDEADLINQIGLTIKHFELKDIFEYNAEDDKIQERIDQVKSIFNVSTLSDEQIHKVAQLIVKFDNLFKDHKLTSVAVRCWPEFAAEFGVSPCAAMSILQSEGRIIACEGDLLASLSMYAHKAIGAETPFLADFSQVNFGDNFALLWHCGVAPCNLWDGKCDIALDTYFAGGKGVTADFVMKSGDISLLRIDNAPGEYRIFLQQGKAISMEKELKGTYAKVVFNDHIRVVLNKIIDNGIAHHISYVYGDFIKPFEIVAKFLGWRVIK